MSYDFDGSGSANLNAPAPLAALPFTMMAWFKVDNATSGHALVCLGNASDSEIMRLSASGDVGGDPVMFRAANSGGSNANVTTSTGFTANTWRHACAVATSSDTVRHVYLDGAGKASTSSNIRDITSATRIAIGAQYQNGSYGADTEGKIAHVAIWNIALSDAEVASLAAGANPLAVQAANLVAYWPLTADLVDVVGAVTLTNGGGVTFDGADNPTVDAPPGSSIEGTLSASIGTISLAATGVGPGTASEGALNASIGNITLAATGVITSLTLEPDDEDSDSYDTATTEVIGDTIYLEGYYDGSGLGGWVNTNCRVSGGVVGATYNVVLDASGKQTAGAPAGNNNTTGSPWTPIVRFKIAGVWGTWSKLSSYSYNGTSKVASGSFTWATGATEARIAYKPVVTVAELDAFRQEIYTSPYAIEPPSSVAASSLPEGVHARITHGTGPNTVASGTVDLWCARVGTGPFVGMVVFAEHAQEDVGDLSAMQFIRWMLGASSEAADFRSRFSVYIYVHNLSGRKCGRTRYNQDATGSDEDPNREWDSSASDQTNAVKTAIELDFPVASVDLSFMLAYHGQQDANVNTAAYDIYTTTEFDADQEFHSRIATAIGSQVHQQDSSPPTTGTSKWFGHTTRSAPLSLTLEQADAATGYPDAATMHDAFAAATGETILSLADDGYFGRLGELSTSIGTIALSAAGTLPVAGALSTSIGNVSLTAAGALDIAGTLSASIGTVGLSSAGALAIAGAASASIGAISLSATGELELATGTGTLSKSIGEISLSAAGALPIAGAVSASIGTIALASTSKVAIAGALSAPVGAVTLTAAGVSTTSTNGTLAATLGPVTLSSAARLAIAGNVNTSIGLITLSATNVAGVTSPTPPERRAAAIGESRRAAA